MIAKKWLVRPYEATEWEETAIEPTEELRRFLEFKPNPNHSPVGADGDRLTPLVIERIKRRLDERSPRHYDSQGYCDNPGRGY